MIQDLNFIHQQRNEIKWDTHQFGTVNSFIYDDAVEEFRRVFGFAGCASAPLCSKRDSSSADSSIFSPFRIEYMRWMVLMQI